MYAGSKWRFHPSLMRSDCLSCRRRSASLFQECPAQLPLYLLQRLIQAMLSTQRNRASTVREASEYRRQLQRQHSSGRFLWHKVRPSCERCCYPLRPSPCHQVPARNWNLRLARMKANTAGLSPSQTRYCGSCLQCSGPFPLQRSSQASLTSPRGWHLR